MPKQIKEHPSDASFLSFVHDYMPQDNLATTRNKIIQRYSADVYSGDQKKRTSTVIRDSSFTCNTRQLFNAYNARGVKVYAIYYNFLAIAGMNFHAADLIPTFVNKDSDVSAILGKCESDILKRFAIGKVAGYVANTLAPAYQKLLIAHAIHGDPNMAALNMTDKLNGTDGRLVWTPARTKSDDRGDKLRDVLGVDNIPWGDPFHMREDEINTRSSCDFWDSIAEEIMAKYPEAANGVSSDNSTSTNATVSQASSSLTEEAASSAVEDFLPISTEDSPAITSELQPTSTPSEPATS